MIGTLAQKRTQLAALAVLAALVAALFAATISSQSATHHIVSTNDSDFLIAEGGTIIVQVEARATAGTAVGSYTFGEIFGFVLTQTAGVATYRHQAGAPIGDFTITAKDGANSVSQTVTVGDPGTNFAEINVILGYTNEAGDARALPSADGAKRETDTVAAGGTIFIEVEALNSNGEPSIVGAAANNADLQVTVFAVGANVGVGDSAGSTSSAESSSTTFGDNTVEFVISTAATDPGRVEVFAVASIGTATLRTLESLFLNFSGGPDMISAGDVSGGLLAPTSATAANTGVISFEVTAVDAAGSANDASDTPGALVLDPGDISTKITDADGEDVTAKFNVDESAKKDTNPDQSTTAGETAIDETKISTGAIAVVIAPGDAPGVAGGTYTAAVTLSGKNTVEVTFHVVGLLATLTAEADPTTVVEDGEFTVTATLLDANGLPVADGKADVAADDVIFEVIGGSLSVFGQDSDAASRGQKVTKEHKGGTASATFYITGDSGKSIVLVRSDDKTARVTVSTGDAADAEAAGPTLDDFSRTTGVAAYTGPAATASELLALLAGRATIVWLSDGDNWIAYYALIDGEEAPGSSNFTVRSGDVLYIGN
ncbi:MAG: hypothetical protein OXH13_00870 [Chloroflexi bacterium]|nr:hypothetical protein [Chloroflexota bacterium]MCY3697188.1 hypothetical protein [Chloroflexota bacterium]